MKKFLQREEKEIEDTNVVPFRLLTGGKGEDDDWLKGLPKGSVFLCKPKGINKVALEEYHVVYTLRDLKGPKGLKDTIYLLFYNLNEPEVYLWVNTKDFSNTYSYVCLLKQGQEEE